MEENISKNSFSTASAANQNNGVTSKLTGGDGA